MSSVNPEVIIVHRHISIDVYHRLFQYVETSLSEDLFLFGKSSSEAVVADMVNYIRDNAHVSQSAAHNGGPLSLAGLSLYIISISYL